MEKINFQLFKFKYKLLLCEYCNKILNKSQISTLLFCKCKICIHCKKYIAKACFKKYEYEHFINQYLDYLYSNN